MRVSKVKRRLCLGRFNDTEQALGNDIQSNEEICHFTLEALAACVVGRSKKLCPFTLENGTCLPRRIA